jgi:hypothetical protein
MPSLGVPQLSMPSGLQPQTVAAIKANPSLAAALAPTPAPATASAAAGQQSGGGTQNAAKTDPPASNNGIIVFSVVTGILVIGAVIKMARSGK